MENDAFTGEYRREFALVCPSLAPAMTAVEWPEIAAETIAAFLTDCTMTPGEFEQRYGAQTDAHTWRELVYIDLTVTTPGGFVLRGRISPARCMEVSDGSRELIACIHESEGGFCIRDAEVSLGMEVDGLQVTHVRKRNHDTVIIRQDGTIILP